VVEQPPVEVVFQQAAAPACAERGGCLKRWLCGKPAPCAAPTCTYAAPAVQTYALAAPAVQTYALVTQPAQSFALTSTPSFGFGAQALPFGFGAQALPVQQNLLSAQVLQSVEQQALAAYLDKLRAGLAQSEAAKAQSAEATDCCQKVDALIATVKELQTVVLQHGTMLADHEKRIQALEKK
jgi:hypothetical protein